MTMTDCGLAGSTISIKGSTSRTGAVRVAGLRVTSTNGSRSAAGGLSAAAGGTCCAPATVDKHMTATLTAALDTLHAMRRPRAEPHDVLVSLFVFKISLPFVTLFVGAELQQPTCAHAHLLSDHHRSRDWPDNYREAGVIARPCLVGAAASPRVSGSSRAPSVPPVRTTRGPTSASAVISA